MNVDAACASKRMHEYVCVCVHMCALREGRGGGGED